ncbi:MAG: hypothetical protein E3J29_02610 [Dehalococcoidia bacterium]|nr:MAG: hypothetical protein E3J29_02610 [Dehalococcoidia bacterium]
MKHCAERQPVRSPGAVVRRAR